MALTASPDLLPASSGLQWGHRRIREVARQSPAAAEGLIPTSGARWRATWRSLARPPDPAAALHAHLWLAHPMLGLFPIPGLERGNWVTPVALCGDMLEGMIAAMPGLVTRAGDCRHHPLLYPDAGHSLRSHPSRGVSCAGLHARPLEGPAAALCSDLAVCLTVALPYLPVPAPTPSGGSASSLASW